MVRACLAGVCLAGLTGLVPVVHAQPPSQANQAERAAQAAERAARAAEAAAKAATEAATAARQAADAAAAGLAAARQPDPDENQPLDAFAAAEPAVPVRTSEGKQRLFADSVQASVANGPSYRSHKTTGSPEFQLVASDDTKIASLALTMDVSGTPPQNPGRLDSTMLTVTASTELAKGGPTNFGDLHGLAGGTEVKLNLTHYQSRFEPEKLDLTAVNVAEAACRAQPVAGSASPPECRASEYPSGVTDFVLKYNPTQARSFVDNVLPGPVMFYGIEAKAGQSSFEYLDTTNFALKKDSRFSWSGTLYVGQIVNNGNTSFSGSFTWARQRKAQDPITLCQAINAIPQTQCFTAAGGPPSLKKKAILGAE
jgi:hypothetical protein